MIRSRTVHVGVVALLLALHLSAPAQAGRPCAKGVDCYCDRVRNAADAYHDPAVLLCEDWEAPTLYYAGTCTNDGTRYCNRDSDCQSPGRCDDTALVGAGAPFYGPPFDASGGMGGYDRGFNSYFYNKYGDADAGGCYFPAGQPSSPRHGQPCDFFDDHCRNSHWTGDDRWGGNSSACVAFIRDGEFADELSRNPEPSNAADGGAGAFDGHMSVGWRNPPGRPAGIVGKASWQTVTEIGITKAWGYSTNAGDAGLEGGLFCAAWKHNEFMGPASGSPASIAHDALTGLPKYLRDETPYWLRFQYNGTSQSQCQAALASTTINKGELSCNSGRLDVMPSAADYKQSNDFPFGTWGCARSHVQGYGSPNFSVRLWHDEELIIDFSGFDGRLLRSGVNSMKWNNYSNANQGLNECGPNRSTEAVYRYEDNVHITAGPPVSCEQIGFGNLVAGPPPPPPPPAAPPDSPFLLAEASSSSGSGSSNGLTVTMQVTGGSATLSAAVGDGTGPFEFLFDCGNDGDWDGVFQVSQPAASYTCSFPSGTHDVKVWVWDEGSNDTDELVLAVTVD